MTPLDRKLAEIAGRIQHTDESPWEVSHDEDEFGEHIRTKVIARHGLDEHFICAGEYYDEADHYGGGGPHVDSEFDFIAHARTDVPALLRAVESYRSMLRAAFVVNTGNDKTKTELLMTTADAAALAALEGE